MILLNWQFALECGNELRVNQNYNAAAGNAELQSDGSAGSFGKSTVS